jgi:hypothetical protein
MVLYTNYVQTITSKEVKNILNFKNIINSKGIKK